MSDTKAKIIWKSEVASNAFNELCHNAAMERERIDLDIKTGNHSEYERSLLHMSCSKVFQEMISIAYETAMDIEIQSLNWQASMAKMFSGD